MGNPFRQRLTNLLQDNRVSYLIGASGLAILSAATFISLIPDNGPAAIAGLISGIGGDVLAGLLQQFYEKIRGLPPAQQQAQLQQLAQDLTPLIEQNPQLRTELGRFLANHDAFAIAQAVADGDPATRGWPLLHIYHDISQYRQDFDTILQELTAIRTHLQRWQPAHPIPHLLPPRAPHFIGRQPQLQKLLNDLQPGQVITLCGPGGIGKTALAAEVTWLLAPNDDHAPHRFPDGIFFYTFYGQSHMKTAYEQIARAFGKTELRPAPTMLLNAP